MIQLRGQVVPNIPEPKEADPAPSQGRDDAWAQAVAERPAAAPTVAATVKASATPAAEGGAKPVKAAADSKGAKAAKAADSSDAAAQGAQAPVAPAPAPFDFSALMVALGQIGQAATPVVADAKVAAGSATAALADATSSGGGKAGAGSQGAAAPAGLAAKAAAAAMTAPAAGGQAMAAKMTAAPGEPAAAKAPVAGPPPATVVSTVAAVGAGAGAGAGKDAAAKAAPAKASAAAVADDEPASGAGTVVTRADSRADAGRSSAQDGGDAADEALSKRLLKLVQSPQPQGMGQASAQPSASNVDRTAQAPLAKAPMLPSAAADSLKAGLRSMLPVPPGQTVELKIQTKDMGEITLTLREEGGALTATLQAATPEAQAALKGNADKVAAIFREEGQTLAKLELPASAGGAGADQLGMEARQGRQQEQAPDREQAEPEAQAAFNLEDLQ